MGKDIFSVVVDEDVLKTFRKYCSLNALDINAKVELLIKKELARRIKEPVTLYSFFKDMIEQDGTDDDEEEDASDPAEVPLETYDYRELKKKQEGESRADNRAAVGSEGSSIEDIRFAEPDSGAEKADEKRNLLGDIFSHGKSKAVGDQADGGQRTAEHLTERRDDHTGERDLSIKDQEIHLPQQRQKIIFGRKSDIAKENQQGNEQSNEVTAKTKARENENYEGRSIETADIKDSNNNNNKFGLSLASESDNPKVMHSEKKVPTIDELMKRRLG